MVERVAAPHDDSKAGSLERQEAARLVHITPRTRFAGLHLRELWDNREFVYFLVWRDIKVRYKQSALGAAWAVLQPLLTMVVFTLVFGRLAKLPSDGIPYPLFAFSALLPWNLFANGLTNAAGSLLANSNLLKKVYLPRMAIPLGAVLTVFVDFLIALGILAIMMAWYRVVPDERVLWVVPLTLLALATSFAAGTWLAALNVRYRDVKYVLPFLVQMWMFITPVVYSSSLIKSGVARVLFSINPMAGVVDGFRYALLGSPAPSSEALAVSIGTAVLMLGSGLWYFRQAERTFADVI